ncbi:unnamed protein product [Owenia fusiformis]|uniref:VWFA domain-containing protein n=1 Tax=Owenia fusiformis TaxID=6347 RepID=A0A8S4PKZ8_OWEFU|nr:unnamed protein product [Owenia fusiformis]
MHMKWNMFWSLTVLIFIVLPLAKGQKGKLCGDVVFVLQTSCNLKGRIIDGMQSIMSGIAMKLTDHQNTTMSLITYSDNAAEVIAPRTPAKFQKTLSNDGIKRGDNCPNNTKAITAKALRLVDIQTSDRAKVVVILNDGISFDLKSNMDDTLEQTKAEIKRLNDNGVMFATYPLYDFIRADNDDKDLQLEYEFYNQILQMDPTTDNSDRFINALFNMEGFLCPAPDAPLTTTPKPCVPRLDLMYLIDRSKSIAPKNIEKVKQFLIALSKKIIGDSPETWIGAISYSHANFIKTELDIARHNSWEDIEKALRNMPTTTRKGTYTDEALAKARRELEKLDDNDNTRKQIPNLIILITDGVTNKYEYLSTDPKDQTKYTTFTTNQAKLLAPRERIKLGPTSGTDLMIVGLPNIPGKEMLQSTNEKKRELGQAKLDAGRCKRMAGLHQSKVW